MSKKKKHKKSDENRHLETIVLITALIQLIQAIFEFIEKLVEQEGAKAPSNKRISFSRLVVNIEKQKEKEGRKWKL